MTSPIHSSGVAGAIGKNRARDNQSRSVIPSRIASRADLLAGCSKEQRRGDRILLSWAKAKNITSTRGVEQLVKAISERICRVGGDAVRWRPTEIRRVHSVAFVSKATGIPTANDWKTTHL